MLDSCPVSEKLRDSKRPNFTFVPKQFLKFLLYVLIQYSGPEQKPPCSNL